MINYKYTFFYILSIALVNFGFLYVPLIPFFDTMYTPMSIVVGLVFVLRDFAQREIGHKVIGAMVVGAILSYFMANPYIAFASLLAFAVSEAFDWIVYSLSLIHI